jgi:hypothetical protein
VDATCVGRLAWPAQVALLVVTEPVEVVPRVELLDQLAGESRELAVVGRRTLVARIVKIGVESV